MAEALLCCAWESKAGTGEVNGTTEGPRAGVGGGLILTPRYAPGTLGLHPDLREVKKLGGL